VIILVLILGDVLLLLLMMRVGDPLCASCSPPSRSQEAASSRGWRWKLSTVGHLIGFGALGSRSEQLPG